MSNNIPARKVRRSETLDSFLRGRALYRGALVTGSNKRYAAQIDPRMFAHVDEMMMRGTPQTLTDAELELGLYPLTRTPLPVQAQAWVRYGDLALNVDVEVVAWTPRAVAVRWMTPTGQQHRAWVWASAVERQS